MAQLACDCVSNMCVCQGLSPTLRVAIVTAFKLFLASLPVKIRLSCTETSSLAYCAHLVEAAS